jgi:very-short-patch-repair endonuclease
MANARAHELRKSMTRQEVKLWVHPRTWRTRGYHFRRQAPRDGYILDFVCVSRRLIVEVDGGQHGMDDQASRDQARDRHFEAQGFRTLRFWNTDIDRNLEGVLDTIDGALCADTSPTPGHRRSAVADLRWPDPPPSGEG